MAIDGIVGDVDRYFTGTAEEVLVVFDPSLGYTTAGGWFYWPDTCDMDGEECDPDPTAYRGDKTNFGWTMKYNKKGTKVQGSMLMIRHTWNGEIYRVKSNALFGMAMGSEGGDYPYGFVSFSGKSNYLEPGWVDGMGNHVFILYAEDAGEQGCNQASADKLWIEVQPRDDLTYLDGIPLNLGSDAANGLEAINCGNIFVPHKSGGNGGGKP